MSGLVQRCRPAHRAAEGAQWKCGAAPSLLWAASALTLVFAPLLIVVSVWLYTLVFGFSALWFTHFALSALAHLRGQAATVDREPPPPGEVIDLPPSA